MKISKYGRLGKPTQGKTGHEMRNGHISSMQTEQLHLRPTVEELNFQALVYQADRRFNDSLLIEPGDELGVSGPSKAACSTKQQAIGASCQTYPEHA